MFPTLSQDPRETPVIPVIIDQKVHEFMVDTGATYSCIGKQGSSLPLSQTSFETRCFSGKCLLTPLTEPIPMMINGQLVIAPLRYSESTPYNLLGRDILCSLKAKIMCTPDN